MTTNRLLSDQQGRERSERVPNATSEARLLEIRRNAESKGLVDLPGIRPAGAPFPVASAETGYYGVPLLKEPQWTWEIPVYFFVGGAAGSAAVIAAIAHWTGNEEEVAHDARWLAAGGSLLSSALLISDLGRPSRFVNMLRMFKPQSAMSMGAWTLAFFGPLSGAALLAHLVQHRYRLTSVRLIGNIAETLSAVFGLPFSNYTGVLMGATAIPVWNHNIKTLPVHFGMSGLASAVSILELAGNDRSRPLAWLGTFAAAMETYEGFDLEIKRDPRVNRPLKRGTSGWITRVGGVLSGPLALGLRVGAMATGSRRLRRTAALSSIVGSLLTRIGWVAAGHASALDWRLPLAIPPKAKAHSDVASKPELSQMRKVI